MGATVGESDFSITGFVLQLLAFFRVARSIFPLVFILPLPRLRRLLHGRRTGSCLDLVSVVGRVHMQP